jgi:hypothetical protein
MDSARAEAEYFIQQAFSLAYGATIESFLPVLLGLRNDQGQLQAVLGLREAADTPLYLEQYLDRPVEQELSAATNRPVNRSGLVEVGNFAVGAPGGGRWLITALTAYLSHTGHDWAVFTCGPELQNASHRLGIGLVDLGEADPSRLPDDERARWGSYYQQHPHVMAANVDEGVRALFRYFERECSLLNLWRSALRASGVAA